MKILTDKDGVIVAISNNAEIKENGVHLDGCVYCIPVGSNGQFLLPVPTIHDVETVPEGVGVSTHKYTETGGFIENITFLDKVAMDAIDKYTFALFEGGVM